MATVSTIEGNVGRGEAQVVGSGTKVTVEEAVQTGKDLNQAPELRNTEKPDSDTSEQDEHFRVNVIYTCGGDPYSFF